MSDRPSGGNASDFRADGYAAVDWAADYLERVGALPVLAQVAPGDIRARLPDRAPDDPEPFSAVLRDLDDILLPGVTHWQHPRYFAYFATSAAEPGILAELLAATLNSIAILWRTAPASTELEGVVLDWAADLLGLPSGWHGHIEDSASTSTFAACVAAREATGRDLIVCAEHGHSSIEKAARMLGMRLRKVPVDDQFRMRADALGDLSEAAVVVATVGTTATAAVDPVPAIADSFAASGTWLHVDAAYAGSAMVCPEFRWAFAGVDRADSLVVNPHKWLLTPMDCSLLWTSRREDFRRAFSVVPRVPAHARRRGCAQPQRVRARAGAALPRAQTVGGSPLLRPQRAAAPHPQRDRPGVAVRALGPGDRRLGGVRASAVLAGVLPTRGRGRSQPRAARAGQRERRDVHLPRRAQRALRAEAGDRAAVDDRR